MPTGSQYRDPITGRIAKAPASMPPSQEDVVLVAEVLDTVDQQMIPAFEEFTKAIQVISKSLDSVSSELSLLTSNVKDLSDSILAARPVYEQSESDTSFKDKLFYTLETLVATSFLTLEAIRNLSSNKKDKPDDTLSLKEKELESTKPDKLKAAVSSPSKGILEILKEGFMFVAAPLIGFFIGFFSEGGSLTRLISLAFDALVKTIVEQISNLFNSLFTAIKDTLIGFVINPIIAGLNKVFGLDIEPLMTTEEQARAAGENTTGTDQIGSTIGQRVASKTLLRSAALAGGALDVVDRVKGALGKETAEEAAKKTGKFGLKSVLKKIPLLGLGFGGVFAAQRALEGDYAGAGAELLSGALGATGAGIGASAIVDIGLAASDTAGITGPAMVQNRNNFSATPSAALLKNKLDTARQTTEEAKLRTPPVGADINNSVFFGGNNVSPVRVENIQPPPEAGSDMGIGKSVR
jgi:hypothetical protein